MRKIATSVGLLAMGASVLHAAESSTLNQLQKNKPWSIQATLNGFYDDNVNTAPDAWAVESAGFDVTPSIKFGLPGEQTSFNVGYDFTARFYDKSIPGRAGHHSYTHVFDLNFAHTFSPRADISLSDSFVIGQEPDLLFDPAAIQRIPGDNIRNFARAEFNVEATDLLSFSLGYNNNFYDYHDKLPGGVYAGRASYSGLFDRTEHLVRIDSNWKLSPSTIGVLGYNYSQTIYNGDEVIAILPVVQSQDRNNRGHTVYVGARHIFSPTLSAALNVGAQYYTYYKYTGGDDTQWSPFIQGSVTYAIQQRTQVDAGLRYSRESANEVGAPLSYVKDMEYITAYGALKHEIVSKLIGTVSASVSHAEYNGGGVAVDGETFMLYRIGLDLAYNFNQYVSAHTGYNFDRWDSTVRMSPDFYRNRVYAGVTVGF